MARDYSIFKILPLVMLLFVGCAGVALKGRRKKVVLQDFAEGRVVQVAVTDRLTGSKELLFLSMPKKSLFLEGYIQGKVTDYEGDPIHGVVVRAVAEGEQKFVASGEAAFQTSSFDAGVSDSNGIYRIRFSLPIIKGRVDIQGSLLYNRGWEQELQNLGKAYKPQIDASAFRLYFDTKRALLVFSEGIQSIIVKPVVGKGAQGKVLPGAQAPKVRKPEVKKESQADDLFKGFGFSD